LAVDTLEALASNETLAMQPLGLPAPADQSHANVLLRLPTQTAPAAGQMSLLRNLAGRSLSFSNNGPADAQSLTRDIVRAMRSRDSYGGGVGGGYSAAPAPQVIGVQAVTLTNVSPLGGQSYSIDALFSVASCAPTPRVGDVIRVGATNVASVIQAGNPAVGGAISNVVVSLRQGSPANFVAGPADYEMPYDPSTTAPTACFVRFTPAPLLPPDAGISPNATISVRFNRPMDPRTVSGLDSFAIAPISTFEPIRPFSNTVVSTAQYSPDLREYTCVPQLPLSRNPLLFPTGEEYSFEVRNGANGLMDRTGQALLHGLPSLQFRLDPAAAAVNSRSVVFNLDTTDQDNNSAPELRGQFLYDLSAGSIRARPVARFSAVADNSQPVLGLQIPFTAPIQTPLSNFGSKLMGIYRYHDLGLGLTDDSTMNIDLEQLAWAPFGQIQVDAFAQFRMAFSHSKYLPDEVVNPFNLLPNFPSSGLVSVFDDNLLDPLTVTHDKQLGYAVQPVDVFAASTGTLMMPYPMNRGVPLAQYERYTFRDTSNLAVGGPNGAGVDTEIFGWATGSAPIKHYGPGIVPTIGLPLLMEFRCYPDAGAFGLNGAKVNLAINSSARPAFRAFSTGGVSAGGGIVQVDPDNEPVASGGVGPAGSSAPIDNIVQLGQADFVVRVNRVHTIWVDTALFTAQYQTPSFHPPSAFQPAGTQVVVALRGAPTMTNGTYHPGSPLPARDASKYDAYGDPVANNTVPILNNFKVTHPLGAGGQPDKSWKSDPALLNNLRFVQMRVTMISNPVSLQAPAITGFGVSLTY
jgi:hypothetical protein